jgi:hypothetical protein
MQGPALSRDPTHLNDNVAGDRGEVAETGGGKSSVSDL